MTTAIFSFDVWVNGTDWHKTVNSTTLGKAKYDYWRDVVDAWEDVKYTDMRGRKLGAPYSSPQFINNAEYRGIPKSRCGQRVRVGEDEGYIVGHNSSANLDILFDVGSKHYSGMVLNVHPDGRVFLD